MKFKIQGGTPVSGKSLCVTCKYAYTVKGQNCQEAVLCNHVFGETRTGGIVPFKVAECTEYHPMNQPWQHELEGMAWKIEARRRGPSGFKPDQPIEVIITPPLNRNETPE